jgi:hypothetical protein
VQRTHMVQKFECGADYTATVILGAADHRISVPIADHAAQLSLSLPPSPRQTVPTSYNPFGYPADPVSRRGGR